MNSFYTFASMACATLGVFLLIYAFAGYAHTLDIKRSGYILGFAASNFVLSYLYKRWASESDK